MLRSRIIPCLLVHNGGLVKTTQFKDPKYIGDPINAVKIFNEKEADELIVLDIDSTFKNQPPNYRLIEKLAAECRMPLTYGGGISNASQALKIIDMGVEKVGISSAAIANPSLVTEVSESVGRQSTVVILDVKKRKSVFSRRYELCTHRGTKLIHLDPIELVQKFQDLGAGEIVMNFVENDGMMQGYDVAYVSSVYDAVSIPLTIVGGAGSMEHIQHLIHRTGIIGAAAGSLFVFKGKYRAVLINYPNREMKLKLSSGFPIRD